jgi:serine/tyrosine/threonine adenylyltransferase
MSSRARLDRVSSSRFTNCHCVVISPKLVAVSKPALDLLGLSSETNFSDPKFSEYFCGNRLHPNSAPVAHCYAGYQFGSYSGQLGDGAAMSLGAIINPQTEQRWELQLKGAGPTPFSRQSDGRKVLRSSIREFLGSEAMHSLGKS